MITVVIKDDGEENVTQLTYTNLWKELKDIPGAELLIESNWFNALDNVKTKFVCFVEADCLVNSGYFSSQLGLFKKNPYFRKLAMMSSATAVTDWANKFYGYNIGNNHSDAVTPNKNKKSSSVYPVQIGYVPGAVMRMSMLMNVWNDDEMLYKCVDDLVFLSTRISLAFWKQGDGNRVHINPNATYVTTETYVNDLGKFPHDGAEVHDMFKREMI